MKRLWMAIVVMALLSSATSLAEGDIAISAQNFPDENFRKGLLESEFAYDANHDGVISVSEQEIYSDLDIYGMGISNAKGIELFPYLTGLTLPQNQLESLDLTGNPRLEYLDVSRNRLKSIDLSVCSLLNFVDLSYNSLDSIDVSANHQLENLLIVNNNLTKLDVSQQPNLYQLCASGNAIKTLDIGNCPELLEIVQGSTPYKNKGVVFWGAENLTIDKDTTLASNGQVLYSPDMYFSIKDLGAELFDSSLPGMND